MIINETSRPHSSNEKKEVKNVANNQIELDDNLEPEISKIQSRLDVNRVNKWQSRKSRVILNTLTLLRLFIEVAQVNINGPWESTRGFVAVQACNCNLTKPYLTLPFKS